MTTFNRLLQLLPPANRAEAALILEKLGDRDSPIFALYAEVLGAGKHNADEIISTLLKSIGGVDGNNTELRNAVIKSFEKAHRVDQQILRGVENLQPTTVWAQAAVGRAMSWFYIAIINTAILVLSLIFLRKSENESLRKLVENPHEWNSYAANTRDALHAATEQARASAAVATLIGAPSAQIAHIDGKIAITFHDKDVTTKHVNGMITITLKEDYERMKTAFGPKFWEKIESAKSGQSTIDNGKK